MHIVNERIRYLFSSRALSFLFLLPRSTKKLRIPKTPKWASLSYESNLDSGKESCGNNINTAKTMAHNTLAQYCLINERNG